MKYCAGIDLGTTNTVCAVWTADRREPEVIPITQLIDGIDPSGFGSDTLLPSCIAVGPGGAFTGRAVRGEGSESYRILMSTKRLMGRPWAEAIEGRLWTAERVAACLLTTVARELLRVYGRPPERTVITVPASFGVEARRATVQAARLAGFDLDTLRLLDEPTSAILAELRSLRARPEDGVSEEADHLVVDIGGGTQDVSLVRLSHTGEQTCFDVIGQSRFTELAGDDFDLNIAGLLLHRFQLERGSIKGASDDAARRLCADLLANAERLKTSLSHLLGDHPLDAWSTVNQRAKVKATPDGRLWLADFSGHDLLNALREFFHYHADPKERADAFSFFRPIQQCLDTAAEITGETIEPSSISHRWLAGGSSRLPAVTLAMQRMFGGPARIVRRPMHAIALGAAWFAGHDLWEESASLQIIDRMFDGIYIELSGGRFEEIVAPRQRARAQQRHLPATFEMPRPGRAIEVNLFLGVPERGRDDGEITPGASWAPIARRRVSFDQLLPAGHPISATATLTDNRELQLSFVTRYRGVTHQGTVAVTYDEQGGGLDLPPVNFRGAP